MNSDERHGFKNTQDYENLKATYRLSATSLETRIDWIRGYLAFNISGSPA